MTRADAEREARRIVQPYQQRKRLHSEVAAMLRADIAAAIVRATEADALAYTLRAAGVIK